MKYHRFKLFGVGAGDSRNDAFDGFHQIDLFILPTLYFTKYYSSSYFKFMYEFTLGWLFWFVSIEL